MEYSKLRGKMVLDRAGEASTGQILLHIVGQNKKLIFISNQRQMGRVTVCLFILSQGVTSSDFHFLKITLAAPVRMDYMETSKETTLISSYIS